MSFATIHTYILSALHMSDARRQQLLNSRSLLLYHLLILARAVGLLLSYPNEAPIYEPLHRWVGWSPCPPDVTWAIICTLAAIGGIWGWWAARRRPTLTALLISGTVMSTAATGFTISEGWVPALLCGTIATWGLIEARLAPRD